MRIENSSEKLYQMSHKILLNGFMFMHKVDYVQENWNSIELYLQSATSCTTVMHSIIWQTVLFDTKMSFYVPIFDKWHLFKYDISRVNFLG